MKFRHFLLYQVNRKLFFHRSLRRPSILYNFPVPADAPHALISTIQPCDGGVPAKLRWVVQELQALDITPIIAWYEPWTVAPRLSIPLCGLAPALMRGKRPGVQPQEVWPGVEGVGIGSWLPGLNSLITNRTSVSSLVQRSYIWPLQATR